MNPYFLNFCQMYKSFDNNKFFYYFININDNVNLLFKISEHHLINKKLIDYYENCVLP